MVNDLFIIVTGAGFGDNSSSSQVRTLLSGMLPKDSQDSPGDKG